MEQVFEIDHKKLRKDFWCWRAFFGHETSSLFPGVEEVKLCQVQN